MTTSLNSFEFGAMCSNLSMQNTGRYGCGLLVTMLGWYSGNPGTRVGAYGKKIEDYRIEKKEETEK